MQKWQTHFEQIPLEKMEETIEEEIRSQSKAALVPEANPAIEEEPLPAANGASLARRL